ncbi:glycoside hydrolase family 65 protein [Ornithinimicrobium pekingense]|uniref:Glycosyl hydrolase n=1 Tax=Ornithinimicrobium pekingense TaxID=384677 RepID=A0ABQ2FC91_9MICO|nr:glycosyl hydrolase family 65 protein [Ornithinimicrobium pekingense]GGK82801.1 glycosyl hydrolase [Ornithinimicrobium pekingense]
MSAPELDVDPWRVTEPVVDVTAERLAVSETLFSLANGFVGLRGTLEDGRPVQERGTFLSGVFEHYPLSYPERGYGDPHEGQAIVSVADGTVVRLLADGTAMDVGSVHPQRHTRTLDLRTGTLDREVEWVLPSGTTLQVTSRRLVSLAERSVCALRYAVRAVDGPAHLVLRSDLAGLVDRPSVTKGDPRVEEALAEPFEVLHQRCGEDGGAMVARTRSSGIVVAAAVGHQVHADGDGAPEVGTESHDHSVRTTVTASLEAGEELVLTKVLGYAWQRDGDADDVMDAAEAAVVSGLDRGWDGLAAAQREVLDDFWRTADVEVDGDDSLALQQALRYCLFQLFCSAALISDAPVGAKGLSGLGYDGHTFWDIEGFVVPALTLLRPDVSERLLRWRAGTLDEARHRADVLDLQGATFAWRTVDGHECSPYWPASTAAMHVNADICRAFWLHRNATGEPFADLRLFEILVETARLWMSMGHRDDDGGWHLLGMTGPDEYTGVVDDNVFTNLMARRNLLWAADAAEDETGLAGEMGVTAEEVAGWRDAAASVHVPWDEARRVHPMNESFTTYREWRFADHRDSYPLQEHHHYAKIYRRQVLKQADLVQALWWCREDFTDEEVARDLDYYEARTVRDSSLSAAVQAVVCAQAGHPDLALRYLREAAMVDLRDVQGDTADGLHLAAVAGAWLAVAAGFGGLREDRADLELAPVLPQALDRVAFRVTWRGRLLHVETTRDGTTVTLRGGEGPVTVVVDGTPVQVTADRPAQVPLRAPTPLLPEPTQPMGREPTT